MWRYRRIPPEIKEKILDSVKNDWLAVKKAAVEYQVSDKTIHNRLRQETYENWESENFSRWEIKRLQKDKEDLLLLIWALNVEINKLKKKKY